MNKSILLLLSLLISGIAAAEAVEVKSYGHYKKMIHMKNTDGVVSLEMAIQNKTHTQLAQFKMALARLLF